MGVIDVRRLGLRGKLVAAFLAVGMLPVCFLGWRTWSAASDMADDVGRSYQSLPCPGEEGQTPDG